LRSSGRSFFLENESVHYLLLALFVNPTHSVRCLSRPALSPLILAASSLFLSIYSGLLQQLQVEGESTWPVPPLTTPTPEWWTESRPTEALARFEAVQFFTARAVAVLPGFHLSAENSAAVAQICYRLDGLPLAIELAAARLKVLSTAQIAERLDKALALLTRGSPLAARRHQTLRATLDWSYDLLAAPE
jgi:predicted ATPase